jgi:hypothetical protein
MDDNFTYGINEIISTKKIHHKTSMTKDNKMRTSNCHLYDYKITIV